jgi:hypothetical protein
MDCDVRGCCWEDVCAVYGGGCTGLIDGYGWYPYICGAICGDCA